MGHQRRGHRNLTPVSSRPTDRGFARQAVPAEEMMKPEDIAEAVRLPAQSLPACAVPD